MDQWRFGRSGRATRPFVLPTLIYASWIALSIPCLVAEVVARGCQRLSALGLGVGTAHYLCFLRLLGVSELYRLAPFTRRVLIMGIHEWHLVSPGKCLASYFFRLNGWSSWSSSAASSIRLGSRL